MANQQPPAGRPWFRLASMARMEAAAAAGAAPNPPRPTTPPVPRLPVPRTQQQSPPSLPPPQMQPPPPPPQVRSPPPPPQVRSPTPPRQPEPRSALLLITPGLQPEIQTRLSVAPPPPTEPPQPPLPPPTAMTPESPKVIRPTYSTPPDLPNGMPPQPAQAQPIELTPNPEPEPEPKLLLPLQPKTTLPDVGNDKLSSAFYNKTQGSTTEKSNGTVSAGKFREDGIKRAITIAGENTGAIMELGSAAHRRRAHDHGGIKEQKEGNRGGHMVEHEHGDAKSNEIHTEKEKPMAAVVNSNVQSINNSIVLDSSCTLQSPGVHITFANHRQRKSRAGTTRHEAHFPHSN